MAQQGQPENIDRDFVRLLMGMRKLVRDEFDAKVAISDMEAPAQLLDYADRSDNHMLQEMGKELRDLLQPAATSSTSAPPDEKDKVHYYRGVAQPARPKEETIEVGAAAPASSGKRIYRGRVVAD